MDVLKDFSGKDMIEQIDLLEDINLRKLTSAAPALFDLYAGASLDKAVEQVVYHTLFSLLDDEAGLIEKGLMHPSSRIRLLAIRKVCEQPFRHAMPILCRLLSRETDPQLIGETIRALGRFDAPALVDTLLPYLEHDDYTVVGWALEILRGQKDSRIPAALLAQTAKHMDEARDGLDCDLRLAMLVTALGGYAEKPVIDFLIPHIHHANPTLRRLVVSALAGMGREVLPALGRCLESGDRGEKIMAANILGLIDERHAAEVLIDSLEAGEMDSNFKFAVYEALGRINSIVSTIGLSDGLDDNNELVLVAVLDGLEKRFNPGVVQMMQKKLAEDGRKTQGIIDALLIARAGKLFVALYKEPKFAELLRDGLKRSHDRETMAFFCRRLNEAGMEGEALAAALPAGEERKMGQEKRIVAADDSNAMLYFYKAVAAEMQVALTVARDGAEALKYFHTNPEVDLLITDMNMPNMTGVELTSELRRIDRWKALPILMATTESEADKQQVARHAGVNDFLSKPFSKETLKRKLAEMLGIPA